ncbi:MAG: FtsK/SpoIIIE domain-containing protein [Acidimicrobiia bacterium]
MRSQEEDVAEEIIEAFLRALWAFRVELGLALIGAALWLVTRHYNGETEAWIADAVAVTLVLAVPPIRRHVRRLLRHARVRRQWARAVRSARIASLEDRVPTVRRLRDIPAGERFDVRVPAGSSVPELERASEVIAAALRVRDLRVRRHLGNASLAEVVIARRDPLAVGPPLRWPHTDLPQPSLWEPIPVGVGENGEIVTVLLPERNLLLGGEPGAGKSVALSMLVATAALDPTCRLWLLDGKLVELAIWRRCASGNAGVSCAEAIEVLHSLQEEMDHRYARLLSSGRRKVSRGDGLALHIVVIDELVHYLTASDRKERSEFAEVLRDLVSRGRAAGIIVLAATQKPSADVVPTSIRDLFGFRWAMRCSTPQASDTILGSGWASAGYSAADVDPATRGVGYLLHEGGIPQRIRSFYLDDSDLAALSKRAEALRAHPSMPEEA